MKMRKMKRMKMKGGKGKIATPFKRMMTSKR
jgi:hypothetical protein